MSDIFLGFVNRAITAGWLVLAVLALRLLLRRAPRSLICLLWGVVAVRLMLPISIRSAASLIPSAQTIVPESIYSSRPVIETGIPVVNSQVSGYIQNHYSEGITVPAGTAARLTDSLAVIWLAGMAILLLYCLGTYLHMRSRLRTAVRLRDDLWQSEWVESPFVLGLFRPRIYLPFRLDEDTLSHVEAHERSHVARGDHIWKVLAFLLLAAYWFHPLLWAAYFLFCRDLESACDERVVRGMDGEGRRRYSEALLRCAYPRRSAAPCPVAFGELGVGTRIKNVLNYRKPAFWIILIAAAAILVTAVCFLTDPPVKDGRHWLRTRRAYNLGETSIALGYGQPDQRDYNITLSYEQKKELARLLRSVSDDQFFGIGYTLANPTGASLHLGDNAALSLPADYSVYGSVQLQYNGHRAFIHSSDLENWLEGVLPGAPLVWRCDYQDELPQSSLTILPEFTFGDLEISYASGSFTGGTPPVCVKQADGSIALTCGTVPVQPGESTAWKPPVWDGSETDCGTDTFRLTWRSPMDSSQIRRVDLDVAPVIVDTGSGETAIDWYITLLNTSVPLRYSLEGDVLTLSPAYPVLGNIPFNDFYGTARYDIDGDGTEEYCTLGMGPTSGLFTFTFAAQSGDTVKYASIFQARWYQLSFVWVGSTLKVKGVTQSGGECLFDISVRDGAVILSENGEEVSYWGSSAWTD